MILLNRSRRELRKESWILLLLSLGLQDIMLNTMKQWDFVCTTMWLSRRVFFWMKEWGPSFKRISYWLVLLCFVVCRYKNVLSFFSCLNFFFIHDSRSWELRRFWSLIGMYIMVMVLKRCSGRIPVFYSSPFTGS